MLPPAGRQRGLLLARLSSVKAELKSPLLFSWLSIIELIVDMSLILAHRGIMCRRADRSLGGKSC